MTKERFSVTLDDKLLDWIESLTKENVFASRVHAIEFCVARVKDMGIKNVILMKWGTGEHEPVFISKQEVKTIEEISKRLDVCKEDALKILIYRGLEEISRNRRDDENGKTTTKAYIH